MKIIFTESYENLQEKLSLLDGEWDDSQANKKVFRLNGGVLNWYMTTGTIQFQGQEQGRSLLESKVKSVLYPNEYQVEESAETISIDTSVAQPSKDSKNTSTQYLDVELEDSEIIIGIVSAVGTEVMHIIAPLKNRLSLFGYEVEEIKVSSLLSGDEETNEYDRIKSLMEKGDELRKTTKNNAILAYGSAKLIKKSRGAGGKKAYIVNSLKHPDEVEILRKIYGQGFYLFGVHADRKRRLHYLTSDKGLTATEATQLTNIDEDEKIPHGQRTRDTYHLSDFFINFGKNNDQVKNTIQRFLELIFSHPYKNPTFDEFSMFMAFSSSVRSGDLSRQVGAVIAKNQQILSTGANECPVSGGGLYWAEVDNESGEVIDKVDGKDYTRNEDSNKSEQNDIIQNILSNIKGIEGFNEGGIDKIQEVLEQSRIRDLTEFGRVVHAEMEAILSCGREGISCIESTLYCTTFPCHNCAKHIIASGISRVVYVEPYPKSKALEFHSDSIELNTKLDSTEQTGQVTFEPFTGVGARRFLDFFSMNLGAGNKLKRKNNDGSTVDWDKDNAKIRVALLSESYLDIEDNASKLFESK
ncbi:MAG: cytidine deaminase [Proteobacteria bacterium]|nr:cytidine deaminase [Pseudomonadota bacterium]MCH9749755.1 cytidine deaminase [Pseudomonadota bacterium]